MKTRTHRGGARLAFGALAAASLLAFALPAARADWSNNNNNGGWSRQGHDWDHGGFRQDRDHGNRWMERRPDGEIIYHDHPSYYYHPYNGPEHRRYYTYNGVEWYINTDTGLRVRISL